jgi:hypothetical protein
MIVGLLHPGGLIDGSVAGEIKAGGNEPAVVAPRRIGERAGQGMIEMEDWEERYDR